VILSACSSSQPENRWQHDAANSCKNYQRYFLQDKDSRASLALEQARRFAKNSANLQPLIDIELSACAMELSSLNPSVCENASKLLLLEPNAKQSAYLHLLTHKFTKDEIQFLPRHYQDFALVLLQKEPKKINTALLSLEPFSSKLVASALAIEYINDNNIQVLINKLSFKGYKKPLISWMKVQMQREENEKKRALLKAKIEVLTFE